MPTLIFSDAKMQWWWNWIKKAEGCYTVNFKAFLVWKVSEHRILSKKGDFVIEVTVTWIFWSTESDLTQNFGVKDVLVLGWKSALFFLFPSQAFS